MRPYSRTALALIGAGAVSFALLGATTFRSAPASSRIHPDTTVRESIPGVIYEAINDSPSNGLAGGVFGIVTGGLNNIGLLGYGTNTAANAVGTYGLAAGPNSIGLYGSATSTAPGQYGTGIYGQSASGNGIYGVSTAYEGVVGETRHASTSLSDQRAGVDGFDLTGSPYTAGVKGTSKAGTGVVGTSGGLGSIGVSGTAATGILGVTTTGGEGVVGFGEGRGGAYGVDGVLIAGATNGDGVVAASEESTGTALRVQAIRGTAITASGNAQQEIMSLDGSGNMILAGTLTTSGTPLSVVHSPQGVERQAYSAQQSTPTFEDTGEAQLYNGQASVRLDPAFAALMDARSSYLVFITPAGNSQGLYVANRTATGFTVRENGNGRSTLAFDYRIVAKAYSARDALRLPALEHHLPLVPDADRVRLAKYRALTATGVSVPLRAPAAQPAAIRRPSFAVTRPPSIRP